MKLLIVESPTKTKTINKYLGKEYIVMSSKGHMVDLPKSNLSVDVENGFKPEYEVSEGRKNVLKELKTAYKDADALILATDLDREGEAIAYHVAHSLGAVDDKGKPKRGHKVERIIFSEITEDAVTKALQKPRSINTDLFNAQQARRVLDRLVGYKLSPVLWKKIRFGLSAGRVQSVALRLIVEREIERRAFKPDEYWSINILAGDKKGGTPKIVVQKSEDEEKKKLKGEKSNDIVFELFEKNKKKIKPKNEKEINKIVDDIKGEDLVIDGVIEKGKNKYPYAPFTTSTLQQTAINVMGFTSKRTMSVAQKLYEQGFITYMRTDSVSMSSKAVGQARSVVENKYGKDYIPDKPNFYRTKSKNAQEAHECIRPSSFKVGVEGAGKMTDEMKKLYVLIWNRAIASQMSPAKVKVTTIKAFALDYFFKSSGTRILFDGYLKVMRSVEQDVILPAVKKGDNYYSREIVSTQHFTQPPARYSEASLVKKLEELGIGRPSTYSNIISTIQVRKYVEKESRYLFPTITGEVVNRLLTKYFGDVVDYDFTADMEDNLDKIANGSLEYVKMLSDFYSPFEKNVKKREESIPRDEFTVLGDAPKDMKCPECNGKMLVKLSRYGEFYSCAKFPDCKGMRGLDGKTEKDIEKESKSSKFKSDYDPAPKADDERDFVLRQGRYGKFWAHPDYPKVKDARPLVMKRNKIIEEFGDIPKTDDGRDYLLKSGRFGKFWSHPDYPKVKDIKKVQKKKKPAK